MEKNKKNVSQEKQECFPLTENTLSSLLPIIANINQSLTLALHLNEDDKRMKEHLDRFWHWHFQNALYSLQKVYGICKTQQEDEKKRTNLSKKTKSFLEQLLQQDFDGRLAKIHASMKEDCGEGRERLKKASQQLDEFLDLAIEAREKFQLLYNFCTDPQANAIELGKLLDNATHTLVSALRSLCISEIFPDRSYYDCCDLTKEKSFEEMAAPTRLKVLELKLANQSDH